MIFLRLICAGLIKRVFALDVALNILAFTLSAAYSVNSCSFPGLILLSPSDYFLGIVILLIWIFDVAVLWAFNVHKHFRVSILRHHHRKTHYWRCSTWSTLYLRLWHILHGGCLVHLSNKVAQIICVVVLKGLVQGCLLACQYYGVFYTALIRFVATRCMFTWEISWPNLTAFNPRPLWHHLWTISVSVLCS